MADTGPEAVIEIARRCGIQSQLKNVYSVALGSSEVTPFEMAAAFATFATGGVQNKPFLVSRVEDAMGQVLEEHIVSSKRTLDRSLTYQLVEMLQGVMDQGTGAITRRMGFSLPAAGKTIPAGVAFAEIGDFHENGNWFYHTHIQVITRKGLERSYITKGYCSEKDMVEIGDLCPSPIPIFKINAGTE